MSGILDYAMLDHGDNGEIYLNIRPDDVVDTVYEPIDGVILDFNKQGKLIGVEIVNDNVQYKGNSYLKPKKRKK